VTAAQRDLTRLSQQTDAPAATPGQLALLDEILARSEFQAPLGSALLQEYLDAIRTWAWSWIDWLLKPLWDLLADNSDTIAPIIVFSAISVSLVVVVSGIWLIFRLSHGSVAGDGALAEFSETGRPRAADELARAREHAASGDPRQAIHHLYLAILLRLDERDHLTFDGALTNRELLPRLTAARELSEPFAALVTEFDRRWYGQTACTAEEYTAFRVLADRVWQAAGAVEPARVSSRAVGLPRPPLSAATGSSSS
jgi:hypothetical protein